MKYSYQEYVLLFKALSDETRLKIIELLSVQELCACDILEKVHISQSTLSYHMKILLDSQLACSRKTGYWTNYWINQEKIQELASFLEEMARVEPLPLERKGQCIEEEKV